MAYQVSSLTVSVNGVRKWIPLHQSPIRRKAEAIALADAQPIRACVVIANTSEKVHENGKNHGGNPSLLRGCSCPRCLFC